MYHAGCPEFSCMGWSERACRDEKRAAEWWNRRPPTVVVDDAEAWERSQENDCEAVIDDGEEK
jgi:hypothetical protein